LESARLEVHRLHEEREHYEEAMKKAFMRGVCALNLEAMTMFQEPEGANGTGPGGRSHSTLLKFTMNNPTASSFMYGDPLDNTVKENSGIFSLIRMRWFPSVRTCML